MQPLSSEFCWIKTWSDIVQLCDQSGKMSSNLNYSIVQENVSFIGKYLYGVSTARKDMTDFLAQKNPGLRSSQNHSYYCPILKLLNLFCREQMNHIIKPKLSHTADWILAFRLYCNQIYPNRLIEIVRPLSSLL